MGGAPTEGGSRRTPGTPQRVPERANAAGYPPKGWVGLFQQPAAHFPIDINATITGPQAVSRMFPTA